MTLTFKFGDLILIDDVAPPDESRAHPTPMTEEMADAQWWDDVAVWRAVTPVIILTKDKSKP